MKVALDAMGGDHAPAVNIGGAIDALRYYPKLQHLYLVGVEEVLQEECKKQGLDLNDPRVSIVHASEVIGMAEPGAKTVRRKKLSSISIANPSSAPLRRVLIPPDTDQYRLREILMYLAHDAAGLARPHHGRDVQAARHDGGVRGAPADIGDESDEDAALELHQVRGRDVIGHQHEGMGVEALVARR